MSEIVAAPGLRVRLLPRTFPYSIAAQLFRLLERGEVGAATEAWRSVADQAGRQLDEKGVTPAVRSAVIEDLCVAVRVEIDALRCTRSSPRSPAPVVPFPGRKTSG